MIPGMTCPATPANSTLPRLPDPTVPSVRRRTRIKFCGLVRAQDVDTAVALGVDAIGLVFYPRSGRLLDETDALDLRRRLPSFVAAVGLFVDAPRERIESLVASVGLDVIQLHGNESPAFAGGLSRPCWRAHRIDEAYDLAAQMLAWQHAEFHLLDSASTGYGGSGRAFDWRRAAAFGGERTIVAGGLDAGNVGEAIRALSPFAVDTSSGIEGEGPRCKDPDRMASFVAAVRAADDATPTTDLQGPANAPQTAAANRPSSSTPG